MKNKGFTLIELLAVIVILAIIALIAVPIVLGIINDARDESTKRSAENYMKAVEQAITRKNLTIEFNPSICTIASGNLDCKEGALSVEVEGQIPTEGTIVFDNGKIKLYSNIKFESTYVTKEEDGEIILSNEPVSIPVVGTICTAITQATSGEYTVGDEYTCNVDGTNDYTFFVLGTEGDKVNLILDANIDKNGKPIKDPNATDKGFVEWINNSDLLASGATNDDIDNFRNLNIYGPITAINYLKEATSSWKNAESITVNGWDELDDNGDVTSTHTFKTPYTLKARLPYYQEIINYSGNDIYNYLDGDRGITNEIYGYWILSSSSTYSNCAWYVGSNKNLDNNSVGYNASYGVRPVITISKSNMS